MIGRAAKGLLPYVYRCEVCAAYATYGYGPRLARGEVGRWWCVAHKDQWRAAAEINAPTPGRVEPTGYVVPHQPPLVVGPRPACGAGVGSQLVSPKTSDLGKSKTLNKQEAYAGVVGIAQDQRLLL